MVKVQAVRSGEALVVVSFLVQLLLQSVLRHIHPSLTSPSVQHLPSRFQQEVRVHRFQ